MAFKSLIDTLRLLVITPYVWICGMFAAFSILAVYFIGLEFSFIVALPVGLVLLFVLPAFIAGSYGIILENHGSPKVYAKYVKIGYFKCLLPMLLIILIGFLAVQALTYILLMFGLPAQTAFYFGLFIVLPIIFFWYFADLCALLGARGLFGSLKSSSRRVSAGSFSVTAFYLFNIAIFFVFNFIFDLILPLFLSPDTPALQAFAGMSETEIINMFSAMTTDQLMQYFMSLITPEVITAFMFTLAICVFFALPFFVTYKVCYFKRLLTASIPNGVLQNQPDGEENKETDAEKQADYLAAEPNEPAAEPLQNHPATEPAPREVPAANIPQRAALPQNDPHYGEDGEYDAKGRWFKYT
ncbi:MAG TPA: hypothetical protein O0X39_00955 [Methanocorpusculum sp.]|nr:hypothetical protein [Methanocorpusculum sp.]